MKLLPNIFIYLFLFEANWIKDFHPCHSDIIFDGPITFELNDILKTVLSDRIRVDETTTRVSINWHVMQIFLCVEKSSHFFSIVNALQLLITKHLLICPNIRF